MCLKKGLLIIKVLVLVNVLFSFSQSKDVFMQNACVKVVNNDEEALDSIVLWDSSKKLTWDDFLGKPDVIRFKNLKAVSSIGFYDIKNRVRGDSIEVFLYCYFNRYESWKTIKEKELLNHEQKHFDLAEVVVRRLRKKVSNYSFINERSFWYWYNNVALEEYDREVNYYYDLYDRETNHGVNKASQEDWNQKINKMLEELEEFSSPRVVIRKRGNSRDKSE